MPNLSTMPDDILNKLIEFREETIQDKIDNINDGFELLKIVRLLDRREDVIKAKMAEEIKKGCIYEITFEANSKRITGRHTGLYLINSVYLGQRTNCINVAPVEPDPDHQRSFGYYKITDESIRLNMYNVIKYSLVHKPSKVDWSSVRKGQIIGISEPWMMYPNAPLIADYDRRDIPDDILYDHRMVFMKNRYAFGEVYRVHKNKVSIVYPHDVTDPRPNRPVYQISFAKNSCYLLDKEPLRIEEMVY